jgi:hypothetical protein
MRSIFLTIFFTIIALSLNAQLPGNGNVQVVVKGVITDEFSGKPCETTITIKDKNGKKFKIKSNSLDGTYEQVLNAGETYEFTFLNFDVLRKVESLYVEPSKKYTEQKADFTVKKLAQGLHLYAKDIFPAGTSELTDSLQLLLKEFDEILIYNRSAKFEFVVTAHDTYCSAPKIVEQQQSSKSKKLKKKDKTTFPSIKQQPDPDAGLVKTLVDNRMKVIEELTAGFMKRNKHRLSYRVDYSLAEPCTDASKLARNADFIIQVSEIKNAFE